MKKKNKNYSIKVLFKLDEYLVIVNLIIVKVLNRPKGRTGNISVTKMWLILELI